MNDKECEFQLRTLSPIGLGLAALGTLLAIVAAVVHFIPKQNPPRIPGFGYLVFGGGIVLLVVGVLMVVYGRVTLRVFKSGIEFCQFNIFVPWKQMTYVGHDVAGREKPEFFQHLVMIIRVTREFGEQHDKKKFIQKGVSTKHLSPKPHVCLKANFNTFGPHASLFDMIHDFEQRAGTDGDVAISPTSTIIDPALPLKIRKKSQQTMSRTYIHDLCGRGTVISGTHFQQLCNPLQFCLGTICTSCGESALEAVRWEDTGEKVSDFRSRMFKNTNILLKILQYFVFPSLFGLLADYIIHVLKPAQGMGGHIGMFICGYFVGLMVIMASPLGQLVPLLGRKKYWHYK